MSGEHRKIGEADIKRLRQHGPDALRWQREVGLAEARSRCIGLVISGSLPFVGWLALGWTPASMLLLMAVDVLAVLLGDALKLAIAAGVVRSTHASDHRTQQMLSIVGGLEDGTGRYTDHGTGVSPALLLGIATVCSVFLIPVGAAAFEPIGLAGTREALHAPGFIAMAAISLALRVGSALLAAIRARISKSPGNALYLDAGGIVGLYVGLLLLVWLPLMWGESGVILLLAALFAFRLAFGLFALYWIPRVTRALDRFLSTPP